MTAIILWLLLGTAGACIFSIKSHGRIMFRGYPASWALDIPLGLVTFVWSLAWRGGVMSREEIKLEVGQLWWDKDHRWSDGSKDIDLCYLILSADLDPADGVTYWRCAKFLWAAGGYCGASLRSFTEDEISLMECVGSIKEIKSF